MPEAVGTARSRFSCPDCGDIWELHHLTPVCSAWPEDGKLPEFCPSCGKRVGHLYAMPDGIADAVTERFRSMNLMDQARIAEDVRRSFMTMPRFIIDRKEMR